ncbi:MAG TPA: DUF4912 domain-containing protein [Vicinamibacteria bacterium]|nr:DUF4912 domain-containing protein [Vicinamibacteria bacterium]
MASSKKKAGAREAAAPPPGKARGTKKTAAARAKKATTGGPKKPAAVAKKPAAVARAAAKKAAPGAVAPRKAAVAKPSARKTPLKQAAPAVAKKAVRKTVAVRAKKAAPVTPDHAPGGVPGLSEEDQIRAAKYLPRELPKRLFEEDRFLFPETYGVNRVRLLVRDPEWIFAYWDVNPAAMKDLARSLGERGLQLSRLTLRVQDPVSGGSSDILLPPGARWWYIRTDSARRSYRAELGVTLPSGAFRRLAESNTVVTPRVGPSPQRARRRMSYRDARDLPPSAAEAAGLAETEAGLSPEPWAAESVDGAVAPAEPGRSDQAVRGGASDVFRPGGASDTFRR